jgi:tRNA (guanine-N7-)-methyltransferase
MDDAMMIVRSLKDQIARAHLYSQSRPVAQDAASQAPDCFSGSNLDEFARVLKPGGRLILATDVDDLAQWMDDAMHDPPLI